jgi:Putative type VII ESX secretion system translocon, EccE
MEASEVRFQFGPPVRATFLGGLRHAQAGFLATAVGTGVAFLRFVPGQIGFGIAVLLLIGGVAAAFGTVEGRPFDDWLPACSHWALIVLRGRRRWTSPAPRQGERAGLDGATATGGHRGGTDAGRNIRRAGKPSPPPPIANWQLIYTSVSGQPMGVLRDRKNKTWIAVIAVQGQSFMLLDEGDQVRRLSSWATVQASMARQGSPISRMQWLERTLTEVGDEMRAFFEERARTTVGTAAHASYIELLASAQPVTQQHETYLVLQISASKAGRAIKHAGGGDKGAVAVLYRELDHLQRQLRESDLNVNGFLSGDQLAMLLRTQFDPEDALALTARQSRGSEPLISARSAWPLATEVSWGHYRTDRMYHITYWVAEWPKLGVRPSFLSPLLLTSNGVTRTISVVAEPIPTAQAVRKVEHAQTARLSDDEIRSTAGYRLGARRRREGEALDRRENELADGHSENRYSGYVTVSGSNLEQVEVAAATLEQIAYQCPVELRRLWGEQDTSFYCTMPLAQGLT